MEKEKKEEKKRKMERKKQKQQQLFMVEMFLVGAGRKPENGDITDRV